MDNYIRFDWAMKRLLRNKADYVVLEGFLSVLLNDKIKISKLLESESNREDENEKANRVDLLAENDKGELFIIEVQNNNETAYFQRMLFGTSKLITEYIRKGQSYSNIKKVYAINIVYFALGQGNDYVYHGTTEFRGIHNNELLELFAFQKKRFKVDKVAKIFPEYYILKVNGFDEVSKTPLDEWMSYFKTGDIPETATAPGLPEAREKLHIDRMSKEDQDRYYQHLNNMVILKDQFEDSYAEGKFYGELYGEKKGREEGEYQKSIEIAKKLKVMGLDNVSIQSATGLGKIEVESLLVS